MATQTNLYGYFGKAIARKIKLFIYFWAIEITPPPPSFW